MGEQQRAAIESSAVLHGVTKDAVFETIAADIHGFGSGIKRRWAEMDAEYDEAIKDAPVDPEGKPIAVNRSAITELARRMQPFIDAGYSTLEAISMAESAHCSDEPEPTDIIGAKPTDGEETRERLIRDLMDENKDVAGHSSSRSRKRAKKLKPTTSHVDLASQDEAMYVGETEQQRAERLAARARKMMENGPHPGRPRHGKEPRMRVSGRLEPSVVNRINQVTGATSLGFVELFDSLLRDASKSQAGLDALNAAIEQWVDGCRDVA